MGATPSPPPDQDLQLLAESPLQSSPPLQLQQYADLSGEVQYRLCSPSLDDLGLTAADTPAPPSPPLPWADIQSGFADCWSANMMPTMGDDGQLDTSPPHLRSPLHKSAELADVDQWRGCFEEQSAEYVPSHESLSDWNGVWMLDPAPGPYLGGHEVCFGPGAQESHQSHCVPEKMLFEVHNSIEQGRPTSPGWQLQDIFATPTVPTATAATSSSASSSGEMDGVALAEITLKSNALRALRDANLCPQDGVEEVADRLGLMHVDPKTSLMSRFLGMLSPSILGFPTNAKQKRKKNGPRKLFCGDTAVRRSARPATRSSSLLTLRRVQASACKQLGLIQHEDEFSDVVLDQYLRMFQEPLSDRSLQGLAVLADVANKPKFVLPEEDMHDLLLEAHPAA